MPPRAQRVGVDRIQTVEGEQGIKAMAALHVQKRSMIVLPPPACSGAAPASTAAGLGVIGGCDVLHRLADGGMSTVYLARRIGGGNLVALKVLHPQKSRVPQYLERFQREGRIGRGLDHPNIIRVFESGQDREIHFLVMEYLEGSDLKTHLRRVGPLSPEEAVRIVRAVCSALAYAHRWDVVHCDVNPRNILLGLDGTVKVGDFGIAESLGCTESLNSKDDLWTSRLGSLAYLSPEQARGALVSPASDLYALGVVFYEMLTGRLPFDGEETMLLLQHLHTPAPSARAVIPTLPVEFDEIIRKAMAKRPVDRYGSAQEFASDLSGETTFWRRNDHSGPTGDETRWFEPLQANAHPRPLHHARRTLAAAALVSVFTVLFSWQRLIDYMNVPEVEVPTFVGQAADQATHLAREQGLLVKTIDRMPHPTVPEGVIYWQNPTIGARVKRGHPVSIVASSGAPIDIHSALDRFFPPP